MQRGRPWYEYTERINDAVTEYALSEKFGWTPQQIREMDSDTRYTYLALLSGDAMAREEEYAKMK